MDDLDSGSKRKVVDDIEPSNKKMKTVLLYDNNKDEVDETYVRNGTLTREWKHIVTTMTLRKYPDCMMGRSSPRL